ncbi:MAG: tetratricopeptide repeat protein [Planctomycetota bacterium]|nr:tetratricopeptide repeat protein [Planctomycetota bacterium]
MKPPTSASTPQHRLASELLAAGKHAEADAALRRILQRSPSDVWALGTLGTTLLDRQQGDQAAYIAQRLTLAAPRNADAFSLLGRALLLCRKEVDAIAALTRAQELDPANPGRTTDLAAGFASLGRVGDAFQAFASAEVACRDQSPSARSASFTPASIRASALSGMSGSLLEAGRTHEAIDRLREAISLRPEDLRLQASLALAIHNDDRASPGEIFALHQDLGAHIERGAPDLSAARRGQTPKAASGPIRVGFLSANFRSHSVAFFVEPLLRTLDRTRFRVLAYSSTPEPDHITEAVRASCDAWTEVHGLGNNELAQTLARDALDIVVDLGGHTKGTRLWALAARPAPIQLTYCGYPDTTGMRSITHRVVSAITDPLEPATSERNSPVQPPRTTESLLRLPRTFLCFGPAAAAREGRTHPWGEPPSLRCGRSTEHEPAVRFVSFNASTKLCPGTIDLWSKLMLASPGSTLTLKSKPLGDPWVQEQFRDAFDRRGVDPERLRFLSRVASIEEHLRLYEEHDVALDPFPYNGTTTTCEALWMGLPLVTLKLASERATHASRVSESLLHAMELDAWVAPAPEAYVQIAIEMGEARRAARWADARTLGGPSSGIPSSGMPSSDRFPTGLALRQRMLDSPLADAQAFSQAFGDAIGQL